MGTIEDDKSSLSSSDSSPAPVKDEEESEQLSTIFRKYSIEQYFWRNYKNTSRAKSLILVFLVTAIAIVLAIVLCYKIFPK